MKESTSDSSQQQNHHQQQQQQQHETTNGLSTHNGAMPGSPKTRLAMLKRSSTKSKAAFNNDPFRFQGDGVDFKGKLIGVRDVEEARGDVMCAEAMRLAKAAVKSTGQHKQRIILNISIDGLKIKDDKTQTVLHNFPVSRISFIARDTSDARAFGFIYSCSDNKYKFYGIKTAQTADRAVLSIRDMFQIVFEMKKAHLAEVKQKQEEQKQESAVADNVRIDNGVAVADLLDLESELHNIEQGYNQLQNIPAFAEDSWPNNGTGTTLQPAGTTLFCPSATSSFVYTSPSSDPFDNSFNPRSIPVPTPTLLPPTQSAFQISQPSFSAHVIPSVWPAPTFAHLPESQPPVTFSETNPFASSAQSTSIPQLLAPDPFDTHKVQQVLPSAARWPTNENTVPPTGGNARTQWYEKKKVSTLEEAFNTLVDMDALVSGPEIKKNPFDELINPPKVPIASMGVVKTHPPHIPARNPAPLLVSSSSNDPFNDDFFN